MYVVCSVSRAWHHWLYPDYLKPLPVPVDFVMTTERQHVASLSLPDNKYVYKAKDIQCLQRVQSISTTTPLHLTCYGPSEASLEKEGNRTVDREATSWVWKKTAQRDSREKWRRTTEFLQGAAQGLEKVDTEKRCKHEKWPKQEH